MAHIDTKFACVRGATAVHLVAQYGSANQLDEVLQKNPSLAVKDDFGYTAMHYACLGGNNETFNLLAERAEDLELDTDDFSTSGVTCLMLAIQSRNAGVIASVLEQSANPFYKDCLGKDALGYAAFMNDVNKGEIERQIQTSMDQWR